MSIIINRLSTARFFSILFHTSRTLPKKFPITVQILLEILSLQQVTLWWECPPAHGAINSWWKSSPPHPLPAEIVIHIGNWPQVFEIFLETYINRLKINFNQINILAYFLFWNWKWKYFWDRIQLQFKLDLNFRSPEWPETTDDTLSSALWVLGLQECATTLGSDHVWSWFLPYDAFCLLPNSSSFFKPERTVSISQMTGMRTWSPSLYSRAIMNIKFFSYFTSCFLHLHKDGD